MPLFPNEPTTVKLVFIVFIFLNQCNSVINGNLTGVYTERPSASLNLCSGFSSECTIKRLRKKRIMHTYLMEFFMRRPGVLST